MRTYYEIQLSEEAYDWKAIPGDNLEDRRENRKNRVEDRRAMKEEFSSLAGAVAAAGIRPDWVKGIRKIKLTATGRIPGLGAITETETLERYDAEGNPTD